MLKKIRELLGRRKGKAPQAPPAAEASAPPVHHGPRVVHQPIPESDLDPDAVKIVRRLTRFDHSAYLVGGCVRDLLLDRHPKDFDIGTSATPRQVKRLFRNCRIIGRRFRLAHIYFQDGKIIEVATFRSTNGSEPAQQSEGDTDLMIRDDNLFGTPEEDALRRDFTINSLFYDLNDGNVLDHADGLGDLRRKLIRTIGDPNVRFPEDPIRILRAIKFAARLDFTIEAQTLRSLRRFRSEIPKAATPRTLEELTRFGREGAARRSFELLRETEVFEVLLPELVAEYEDERKWKLLLQFLEGLDRRREAGHEVTLGELVSALLLPPLAPSLGWNSAGRVDRPRGLEVEELVDARLRPISLRLRVPRREQERCRQLIALLQRMVPVRRGRRSGRQAIARRASFEQALGLLETLSRAWGGDFSAAFDEWSAVHQRQGPRPQEPAKRAPREEAPRRRRRRRRSVAPGAPSETERTSTTPRRPPTGDWDDDYFFTALPQAPGDLTEDVAGDRYGASRLSGAARAPIDGSDDTTDSGEAEEAASPARRRRRPRRRRRRPGPAAAADGKGTVQEPGAEHDPGAENGDD